MRLGHTPILWFLAGLAALLPGQTPPVIPDGYVLVDDMIVPESAVLGDANFTGTAWSQGIVPFTFASGVSASQQQAAIDAMAEWEAVANVDFVPRSNQSDFIRFLNSTANNSYVGRIGGMQDVNIVSWGSKYIICHELMHALSFNHEQNRPDRDSFVTINWQNISQTACNGSCDVNFQRDNSATTVGSYDFLSIMHYSRNAFGVAGADTITCLPAFSGFQNQMGQRTFMTISDALGLQGRYGPPSAPVLSSVAPLTANAGGATFTMVVFGSRFLGGSPNSSGVQGTRVRWNGTDLPTTYISPTQVNATVDSSLISYPQAVTITVNNPTVGGESNPVGFSVICGGGALALAQSVPQSITSPCTRFIISPVGSQWNVVGISSTSDWDVNLGTANSWNGGNSADFCVANGELGSITPAVGDFPRFAGTASATAEFRTPGTMGVGSPLDTSLPAGAIFRAYRLNVATAGSYDLTATGTAGLRWYVFAPGSSAAWRPAGNAVAVGAIGTTGTLNRNLSAGGHLVVVARHGGPAAATEPFTVNVCPAAAPVALPSNHNPILITNNCQQFNMTPVASSWNVVGITSSADWDITMGTAEGQSGGALCDFLVADGRAGTVSPTAGLLARFSGNSNAHAQHGVPVTWSSTNFVGSASWATNDVLRVYELSIASTIRLDLDFTGSGFLNWRLYAPGQGAAWRRRADAVDSGPINGGSLTNREFTPGVWAFVIHRDGPTGTTGGFGVTVVPTPNPVPTITAVSPASLTLYNGSVLATITGTGFLPSSVARWNGSAMSTTFVDSTTLQAWIFFSMYPAAGSNLLTVFNPAPGGGSSAAWTVPVLNPSDPQIVNVGPNSLAAGSPQTTIDIFGVRFAPGAVLRWNGTPLSTTFVDWMNLDAVVPAALLASAGTATLTVSNPAPGGGVSPGLLFLVTNPAPVLTAVSPSSSSAVGSALSLTLTGSGFNSQSVARWNGTNVSTTLVSSTQLGATVPASLTAIGGIYPVTVLNPTPGGGTSAARNVTLNNPAPIISSLSPTTIPAGSGPATISVGGLGFVATSTVQWDLSTPLGTTILSPTQIQAVVPAALLATAGTHGVRIMNPAPGGGNSLQLLIQVTNPAPVLTSIGPASAVAGSPALTVLANGSGFVQTSVVRLDGTDCTTTFVSATQLSAVVPASLLAAPRIAAATVFNPAPGGGSSSSATFNVLRPAILSVSPSSFGVLTPLSPATSITVTGLNFLPGATIHANGEALPTTVVSATQLQAAVGPGVIQTLRPGGVAINVAHGPLAVSNTAVLRIGSGNNVGTVRRQPLDPAPGESYAALLEGGTPLAPLSLYVDVENPTPLTAFPDASANLVLSVGPLVGSGALFFPLLEGIGLFGAPDGSAFGADGTLSLPGFAAPNPPLGLDMTIQTLYLDPAAPYGFRLGWARWPDSL